MKLNLLTKREINKEWNFFFKNSLSGIQYICSSEFSVGLINSETLALNPHISFYIFHIFKISYWLGLEYADCTPWKEVRPPPKHTHRGVSW